MRNEKGQFIKGHPQLTTPESYRKVSLKLKGHIVSDKTKELMSESAKKIKHKPQQGFQRGHKTFKETEKTRFKKGVIPWNKEKEMSSEYKKKCRERQLRIAKRGEESPWWKGGISFEPYTTDWNITLKRAIRERDNYICQICSQYGNIVHHIDYDKKNCNPDNLITLCRKCHSKTNGNRSYWKKLLCQI